MKQVNQHARFLKFINWFTVEDLEEPAQGWIPAIASAGYEGVQFLDPPPPDLIARAVQLGLRVCGSGRVNAPGDAWRLANDARSLGLECLTLHVGWGYEEEDEAFRLIEAVLEVATATGVPMYVETHRATIFQDTWRTVQFIRRFPELRFNGDWSHWYTGLEFVYGGFERKLEYIQPVVERTEFMHGRFSDPGCIQVDVGDLDAAVKLPFVQHYQTLWTQTFAAFLRRSPSNACFRFAAELLPAKYYYARARDGREQSSRWEQALVLTTIAEDCFATAALAAGIAAAT